MHSKILFLFLWLLLLLWIQYYIWYNCFQYLIINRLYYKIFHSHLICLLFLCWSWISCACTNILYHGFLFKEFNDFLRGLISVLDWHVNIHENNFVLLTAFVWIVKFLNDLVHCFLSIETSIHRNFLIINHFFHYIQVKLFIINDENLWTITFLILIV